MVADLPVLGEKPTSTFPAPPTPPLPVLRVLHPLAVLGTGTPSVLGFQSFNYKLETSQGRLGMGACPHAWLDLSFANPVIALLNPERP